MKLPNGYGSVRKLSGKRRNPWRVEKTLGWDIDLVTKKKKQKKVIIGYFPTRKAGLDALAAYNKKPWDVLRSEATLEYCYEKWSERHYKTLKESSTDNYRAAWKYLEPLHSVPISDIKTEPLQEIIDGAIAYNRSASVQKRIKTICTSCFNYAIQNDLADKNYASFLITQESSAKLKRLPYSDEEIQSLWNIKDDFNAKIVLILLYTGMRVNELLEMPRCNVDIDGHFLHVTKAKTAAGVRYVPIHPTVFPIVKEFYDMGMKFLINNPRTGKRQTYSAFTKKGSGGYSKLNDKLHMVHHLHDTRHTFVSRAAVLKLDDTYIKLIIGHELDGTTKKVYTHIPKEELYSEIHGFYYNVDI